MLVLMMNTALPVDLAAIRQAHERIREVVIHTPVVTSPRLDDELGLSVVFKCENLQHVSAFKARGACNAVFSLEAEQAAAGVVTHSSGNHAAALARAARLRGLEAHVVMPGNSSPNKIAAVRRYGVEPVFCEPTAEARQATAERLMQQTGATMIHPFNDPRVIAGQGTVALELLQQDDSFDTMIVPVGGGGLLSGCLIAAKTLRPDVKVIAAEPAWADDAYRSLKSGRMEAPTRYDTVADGLRTPLGTLTFPIIHSLVDDILLVEERAIVQATKWMLDRAKLVVEPSGAVPLACLMAHKQRFRDQRVAIVISGGNLDLATFDLGVV
jgi:threonine dehydratase